MILSSKGKTLIVEENVEPEKVKLEEDVTLVLTKPINIKAKKDIKIEFKFGEDEDVKIIKVETDNDYEEIEISRDLNQDSFNKEIAAKKEVKEIIEKIESLGDISLEDKDKVESIRSRYKKLNNKHKNLVTNLAKLEEVEEEIKKLEEAKKEKERQDKIVKDTLEKINEANSLNSLGSVVISKDISKARQEKLVQAKEDKRKELESVIVSNIKLQLKEINTLEELKSIKIPNGLSKETSAIITELVRERKIELLNSEHIKVLEEVKSKYPEKNYSKYNKDQYNEILDKLINLENLEQLDQVRSKVEESLSQIKTDREIDIEKSIDNYKNTYNDLLSKNEDNLILADKFYIEKALSEYDNLDKEVKEALASSKEKLDEFYNKIKYIENELVKSLKLSIQQAETVESLENIIVDKNLSKENKEVINSLIKDKKEALLKEEKRQDNVVNEFKVKLDNEKELNILKQIEIPKNINRDRQESLETYKNLKVKELENTILLGLKKEIEEANNLDELNDIKLPKGLEKSNENEILDLINSKEIELFKNEKEKELLSLEEEYPKDNYRYSESDYNLALEQLENLESIEDLDETVSKVKEMLSKLKTDQEIDQEKIDKEVSLFKEKHSKILAYKYDEITLKEEDIINNFLNDYNNLSDVIKDRLLEEKNLVNKYSKRIEELKFIEKKNEKKSEIEKEYPAANYTKKENKNLYDDIVNRVNKFSNYEELEEGAKEILAELAEIYTDKDLEEIEKIDLNRDQHIIKAANAAYRVGSSKNFKVSYKYDKVEKIYEVGIDKSQENTSVFRCSGMGIATALINPLTMGSKSGLNILNIPENLISNTVTDFNNTDRSHTFSKSNLLDLTSNIKAFDVFMPDGQSAGILTKIGVLVDQEYIMEYKYRLNSGKLYTNKVIIRFTNNYLGKYKN